MIARCHGPDSANYLDDGLSRDSEVGMLIFCAFFTPLLYCIYSPLPPFPQTTKLFICPHKVLAIVLWDIQMLFCYLQTCSSAFFVAVSFFWTMFAPCTFLVYIVLYFVDLSKEMLEYSLPTRDFLPIREVLNWDLEILFFLTWAFSTVLFARHPLLGRVATALNFIHL